MTDINAKITRIGRFAIVEHHDFATIEFAKDMALVAALRAKFPKARWLRESRVWSVPGKLAVKRLTLWAGEREAEIVAAAAADKRARQDADFEGRLHEVDPAASLQARKGEFRSARINIHGRAVVYDFTYDARAVAIARSMPGAKFNPGLKSWVWTAATVADVQTIIDGANAIYEIASAVLATREAEKVARDAQYARERAERDATMARVRSHRTCVLAASAPAVGAVLRLAGRVVVIESLGKSFRAGDDLSSMGGPIGAEGEWVRYAYWREATAEEIAQVEAREAEIRRAGEIVARRRATVAEIDREGEAVQLGAAPEGETLWIDDKSRAAGYRRWVVLTGDGWIWSVTYDGSDGAAWGEYNLGYNTSGKRLPATAERLAAIRGEG